MPVSQRLIDLLNAPMPVLRQLAARHNLGVVKETRKWEVAQQLAQLPRNVLEEETGQFLYAGSTSLSWIRLVRTEDNADARDPHVTYPMEGVSVSPDRVIAALREHSEP